MLNVVVIGAGVVGAATAYALTEAGAQVTVLDGGQVAAGTSAATFAVDITRTKTPRTLFDLSLASAREHASLQRRWTGSRWLHQAASLEWERTERDRQRVRDRVRRMHTWGYPAQWMSSQQVRGFDPALTLPTGEAAEVAYYSDGAWYEPPVLARALLERAQQRYASVHVNDPVTTTATRNDRISEVTTAAGRRLRADVVVNCAGPQAADIAALGGAELPLRQVPGLVVTTTPAPTGLRTILCAADLHVRPHRGDRVVLHSWMADGELGERPDPARRLALAQHLLHRAQVLLPGLAPAVVQSALVGVRPVPLDGLPVVGFLPDVDNLYVVVSHSAVHLAPVLGRLAAREISGDLQERLDPFRATRFCPGDQERDVLDDNTRIMLGCISPPSAQEPSMPSDPASWTLERRTATTHGEIAWDLLGAGPPVVLVHGTPARSVLWREVASLLADRFTVYVFDLVGFGQSERYEAQEVSTRIHGQVLAELVQTWGLEEPALVGHDIGGAAVLRAHLLEGTPARKIGLVDAVVLRPWITATTRHLQANLDVYRTMPTHIFREVAAAHLRTATEQPMKPEVFAAYFDQWEGEHGHQLWVRNVRGLNEQDTADFEPLLDSMDTPTRIMWGEQDRWLPLQVSAKIQARLPSSDLVVIPAAGHFSPEDQPTKVAETLVDFLS